MGAGNTAAALRRTPDVMCGPMSADVPELGASGVHENNRGITWGAVLGLDALRRDCIIACTNVVQEPIRGARERRAVGAFKGLGRALLGLVVRPTAGALDVVGGVMRGAGN